MGKRTREQSMRLRRQTPERASFLRDAARLVGYLEGRQLAAAMSQSFEERPDGTLVFRRPAMRPNNDG